MLLGGTLYSSKASADDCWFNIQPAFNTSKQHVTVRLEGGSQLTDRLSLYGFSDVDATPEKSFDLKNFYIETRLSYALTPKSNWAAILEYNGGNGMQDILRTGFTVTGSLGKGNFTKLKVLLFETSGAAGPQVALFTSQRLTDKLSARLGIDYNVEPRTIYYEPELDYMLNPRATLFLQGRSFGLIKDRIRLDPILGLKYNLSKTTS